jgi:hypothetical protein
MLSLGPVNEPPSPGRMSLMDLRSWATAQNAIEFVLESHSTTVAVVTHGADQSDDKSSRALIPFAKQPLNGGRLRGGGQLRAKVVVGEHRRDRSQDLQVFFVGMLGNQDDK